MKAWEYAIVEVKEPITKVQLGLLDRYGKKGWESYAVTRVARADGHQDSVGFLSFHMKRATPKRSGSTKETGE